MSELIEPGFFQINFMNELRRQYPAPNVLLHLQLMVNNDFKRFVDRPSKLTFDKIEEEFRTILTQNNLTVFGENERIDLIFSRLDNLENLNEDQKEKISDFVDQNFEETATGLKSHIPKDFNSEPQLADTIEDESLRDMVLSLNNMMKELSREKDPAYCGKTTLIDLKHPFFVPGGRFNEFYYWDSFWILKGLLVLDMKISAGNILKNFTETILEFEYFPNATRTYYKGRSQPPYYPQMLEILYQYEDFRTYILEDGLNAAIKEYNFFAKNFNSRYNLNYYDTPGNFPRPESFRDDFKKYKGDISIFRKIRSIAESGWDFSSRWVDESKRIIITEIFPADLNSLLYKNEKIIARLSYEKNDLHYYELFNKRAEKRKNAINDTLFNTNRGTFSDFNFKTKKHNKNFYASNLYPIIYGIHEGAELYKILLKDFNEIFGYAAGIPASNKKSGEQWDLPNVWAPYTESLENYLYNIDEKKLSLHIAGSFFKGAFDGYTESNKFFEKYSTEIVGKEGEGGEYKAQAGFSWTNGALLCFINRYGEELMEFDFETSKEDCKNYLEEKVNGNSAVYGLEKDKEQGIN